MLNRIYSVFLVLLTLLNIGLTYESFDIHEKSNDINEEVLKVVHNENDSNDNDPRKSECDFASEEECLYYKTDDFLLKNQTYSFYIQAALFKDNLKQASFQREIFNPPIINLI